MNPIDKIYFSQDLSETKFDKGLESFSAFLQCTEEEQESILQTSKGWEEIAHCLEEFDCVAYENAVIRYLFRGMGLLKDIQTASSKSPKTLEFFLFFVSHIIEKGHWPWTLIEGKTFLDHVQEGLSGFPTLQSTLGPLIAPYKESMDLFRSLLLEEQEAECLLDEEEKQKQYEKILKMGQTLSQMTFPGASAFTKKIQERQDRTKGLLQEFQALFAILQDGTKTEGCQLQEIRKTGNTYARRVALTAFLSKREAFTPISLFLKALFSAPSDYNFFRSICLEKVQHLEECHVSIKPYEVAEQFCAAWNDYCQNPQAVIYNEKYFTPLQRTILLKQIQEKIIKQAFNYLLFAQGDITEAHQYDLSSAVPPSLPLSFRSFTQEQTCFLPISFANHVAALLLAKDEVALFNTGGGLKNNHPEMEGQFKFQTCIRYPIPRTQQMNQKTWKEIRALRKTTDFNQLYRVLEEGFIPKTKQNKRGTDLDFEKPQYSGDCMYQVHQAKVRDDFLCMEQFGSKEERYAAHKLVLADFQYWLGQKHFPKDKRNSLSQNDTGEKQALREKQALLVWEEKEKKLQAILDLAGSLSTQEKTETGICHALYRQLALAKTEKRASDQATEKLQGVLKKYWQQMTDHVIAMLQKMRDEDYCAFAVSNYRIPRYRKDLKIAIEAKLKKSPHLKSNFDQSLKKYSVSFP